MGRYWEKVTEAIKPCHRGTKLVFQHEHVRVYGGGQTRGLVLLPNTVILDLADVVSADSIKLINIKTDIFEKYRRQIIKVPWRDFSIPALPREFWVDLIEFLKKEKKDLIVCCQGGHGRTGTALAILAGICGITKQDPVKYIRKVYCKNAVESDEQIDYITEITNINIKEQPAKVAYTYIESYHGGKTWNY